MEIKSVEQLNEEIEKLQNLVRSLYKERTLSRKQLMDKAKISDGTISNITAGKDLKIYTVVKILRAFGLKIMINGFIVSRFSHTEVFLHQILLNTCRSRINRLHRNLSLVEIGLQYGLNYCILSNICLRKTHLTRRQVSTLTLLTYLIKLNGSITMQVTAI